MAYVTVQKEVIVKQAESNIPDSTYFAWVSIYKKEGSDWKIDCVASTNR